MCAEIAETASYTANRFMVREMGGKRSGQKRHAAILAALACGLCVLGCGGKEAIVKAATAEMQPITRTVSTNGKVELVDDFQAHASAAGQVKQILVKVGETVRQGQELIHLDDADAKLRLENADAALVTAQNSISNLQAGGNAEELLNDRADLISTQSTLRQAQARLNSLQKLQASGASSANEVSAAQVQVTDAQNRLNAVVARQHGRFSSGDLAVQREQVTRSASEVASARNNITSFDVRAPFAGTIYAIPVIPYAAVNPGEDLVNMADLTKIRVRAFFDEPEIGRLAVGQPVRIAWEAKPDRQWHGHISQTPTSITNYGTRNVGECLITVDDAKGDLIPNVNVTVYVTTLHRDSVLAIPRESLRTDGTDNYVFKIMGSRLERTPVQVDVLSQTRVQITSGLQPGDSVVQVPLNDVELRDGLQVKVQH